MALTHESQNTFWQSRLPESTFGTKTIAGADYVRILTTDKSPFKIGNEKADDKTYANGSDIAENVWTTMNMSSKTFPYDFNFTDILYDLYDVLGAISSSGAGATKTHEITPQNLNTSRAAKSRTFGEKLGGLVLNIYTSGVKKSLTISGAKNGRLQVSTEVEGNGKIDKNPASYAQPALSTNEFGYSQQCSLNFGDGGDLDHTVTCDLETFSWNFNNNTSINHRSCSPEFTAGNPEAGTVASEALIGERDYKFNFTYRLTSADDPMRDLVKSNAKFTIAHTITSTSAIPSSSPTAYFGLTIQHDSAQILEANFEVVDGYNCVVGSAILLSENGSLPLTVIGVNNTASYTA